MKLESDSIMNASNIIEIIGTTTCVFTIYILLAVAAITILNKIKVTCKAAVFSGDIKNLNDSKWKEFLNFISNDYEIISAVSCNDQVVYVLRKYEKEELD